MHRVASLVAHVKQKEEHIINLTLRSRTTLAALSIPSSRSLRSSMPSSFRQSPILYLSHEQTPAVNKLNKTCACAYIYIYIKNKTLPKRSIEVMKDIYT